MGGEFAQEREWSHERSLDWHLLEQPRARRRPARSCATSTASTASEPALWELDSDPAGFWWLEAERRRRATWSRSRAARRTASACSCASRNLSPVPRGRLPRSACRAPARWREVLNTDSSFYGGSDVGNLGGVEAEPIPWHGQPFSAELTLPPLAAIWLVPGCRASVSVGAAPRARRRALTAGTRVPRLGAARRSRSRCASGGRDVALSDGRLRRLRGDGRRRRRATTTASSLDGGDAARTPARAGSPTACAGPRACSTPARFEWTDAGCRPAPLAELVLYELHVGTFTPRGHVRRRRSAHLRELRRARRHRDRADAGGRRSPARAAGATTASTCRRRTRAYGGPEGLARLVDAAHAAGPRRDARRRLQPPRRLGREGDRGVRPLLHRPLRDAAGGGRSTSTTRDSRPGARVGAPERRAAGCATSTSTACGSTRARDRRLEPPSTSSPSWPRRVHAVAARRARDRRERPQRPARDARRASDGGYGLRRRSGPTTSTTRCTCC